MPVVRANGVNLYYELSGERGEAMVLIHGSWGDHHNWDRVVPGLSKNFRVLTYDRRGHSQSEKVATQGSFDQDAEDAATLIEQLGLAPANIVGNSGGSSISLKLAAKHPTIFRSLTVHEPPLFELLGDDPTTAPMLMETKRKAEQVAKLIHQGDMVEAAHLFVETLAFGPGQWDKLTPRSKETFIINAETFLDETKDPTGLTVDVKALSQFRKPTMLTYGGNSPPPFKPIIEKLARIIPSSKVSDYPDAGHTPHISHPDEFVRKVA